MISPKKYAAPKKTHAARNWDNFRLIKKGISYFLYVWYIYFRIALMMETPNDINFYRNWPKSYVILEMINFVFFTNYFFVKSYLFFQQQSDIEWKYGFAKLIRNYHTTNASPPPINLVTTWTEYIRQALGSKFIYITPRTVASNRDIHIWNELT